MNTLFEDVIENKNNFLFKSDDLNLMDESELGYVTNYTHLLNSFYISSIMNDIVNKQLEKYKL
jgi:hypothetical protein